MFTSSYDRLAINKDAFSHSQIMSKQWLVDELVDCVELHSLPNKKVAVYGGWYGLLPLFLSFQRNFRQSQFESFDLDPSSNKIAHGINDALVFENQSFKATKKDVNKIKWEENSPDIVINTSCEHLSEHTWFENIPEGTLCAFQSNDMKHEQHCNLVNSTEEMMAKYPLKSFLFSGEKSFNYANKNFRRFMIIGIR